MIGRRCHCGCRANLERCNVRSDAKYASKTCRRRNYRARHPKASLSPAQSQIPPVSCDSLPNRPHIYASTLPHAALLSLSGREKSPRPTLFSFSTALRDAFLSTTFKDKRMDFPKSGEPESLERQFVRHVYADDCKLPYRPASLEPKLPKPQRQPPVNLVLGRLLAAGCEYRPAKSVDEWQAMCPTHEDSKPSLVVRRNPDGSVWLKCWAGCSKESVLAALGMVWRDLWVASDNDPDREARYAKPLLPLHLRRAMEQLLAADDERRRAA